MNSNWDWAGRVKTPSFFFRMYKSSSNNKPIRGYTCNNLTPANATDTSRPPVELHSWSVLFKQTSSLAKKYQKVRFVSIFNAQSRYSVQLLKVQNGFIQSHWIQFDPVQSGLVQWCEDGVGSVSVWSIALSPGSLSSSRLWCSIMFSFIQVQLLKIHTVKSTKFLLHVNISIFLFFLSFCILFLAFILYHHHYYYYLSFFVVYNYGHKS